MKSVILSFLLPSYVLATSRRGIGPAHVAAASAADTPDATQLVRHSNSSSTALMGWSTYLDPASWKPGLSDAYKGVVSANVWGDSSSVFIGRRSAGSEASASPNTASTVLAGLQHFGISTYRSILGMVSSLGSSNATMLRARSTPQNAESSQPKTSEVVAGTLGSAGGHRMTLHKGLVHQGFEDTGFGARQSLLTWEVIASITLYAFIGANTASFVARAFQWPWLTSMLLNIFIWPILSVGALMVLIFFRVLAKRQAQKFLTASKHKHSAKMAKEQTSALLAVDEAWCAYHVAHSAHDLCLAKINNKHGVNEVVTPESLGKECKISEKRALRWYRWLAGSASELTVGAVHVKTAELNCADASKICNTLFAIYHEDDDQDTLSITDALNVLQGWAAGKYGASHIKSADMDYLINTLLAVLLSKCKHGSVNKADWMKLADDYPEFFDVEPQYPQHVRYLRLMDRFRTELAQNPGKRGAQRAAQH